MWDSFFFHKIYLTKYKKCGIILVEIMKGGAIVGSTYYDDEYDYESVTDNEETLSDKDRIFASNSKLTQEEREIFLNYNELDRVWVAETSIPKFWRKLEKQGWLCIGTTYYPDGTVCAKTFTSTNSKGVSITNPFKTRIMTDEQKEAARQRLSDYHNSKTDNEGEDE